MSASQNIDPEYLSVLQQYIHDNINDVGKLYHMQQVEEHLSNHITKAIDRGISDSLILFSPMNNYSLSCIQKVLDKVFIRFGYNPLISQESQMHLGQQVCK